MKTGTETLRELFIQMAYDIQVICDEYADLHGKPTSTIDVWSEDGKLKMETNINIYQDNTKWCECNVDYDQDFYDDGEHEECHKHHWRCSECKKITQIG